MYYTLLYIKLVSFLACHHLSICEFHTSTASINVDKSSIFIEAPEELMKHTQEFKKQIITVIPGIHCAVGFGIANSILIEGVDGNIIVDTLDSREKALELRESFQAISNKSVVAIIYTHHHADHIFGAEEFAGDNIDHVKVYSHSKTRALIDHKLSIVDPINFQRSARQYGTYLTKATGHINNGVGMSPNYGNGNTAGLLYPTNTFDTDSWNLTIAGRNFVFYHAPGETDDHIAIYMPDEEVVFVGDNFYKAFPNIYAIRGTSTRDATQWASSLDIIRNLRSKYLVPSHTRPLSGMNYIYDALTKYRDGIQFVHDQTVRFMNEGLTPDEIIGNKLIRLSKPLQEHPYLQQLYGTVDWSIRAVFNQYLGWFSGKTSDLNPDPPKLRAQNLVVLGGGSKKVFESARTACLDGKYQWCLELTEALNYYPEDLNTSDINELQALSLQKLASLQTSANGRNWYLTKSLEVQRIIEIKRQPLQKAQSILRLPLTNIFELLAVNLDYEIADGINQLVFFHFNDTNEKFSVHVRNGIVDITNKWLQESFIVAVDMIVEVREVIFWKQVITRMKTPAVAMENNEIVLKNSNGEIDLSEPIRLVNFLAIFTL